MEFFTREKLTERITRIQDICGTYLYLVEGDDAVCLLDTGDGFGDLKAYVAALTSKPVTVVLTHGHLDHVGGVFGFDDVYMSSKDLPIYYEHARRDFRIDHWKNNERCAQTPDELIMPYVDPAAFKELSEDTVLDLGGIHLRPVAVPGHTPGMHCVLVEEERYCLFGDACGVFVLLYDDYSSCASEYLASLEHLKGYEDRYDFIIRNHGTGASPKELLGNVMDCARLIVSGTDDHVPITHNGRDLFLAKAPSPDGFGRADGKEGNIAYRADKAC